MKYHIKSYPSNLCIYFIILLVFTPISNVGAQDYSQLKQLSNYQTQTYYSNGFEEQAMEMAKRCDWVNAFYKELIDFTPKVTLLVLSEEDWDDFTNFPVYGMPHYTNDETLIVASEDNDFWKSFIPPLQNLPNELVHKISSTYTDKNDVITMRGFFDLLAIHELGHAYHMQAKLNMQRRWMGELFANIMLHTYIAEKEPNLLPVLTVFPEMVVTSTDRKALTYSSLNELEANYEKIGQEYPVNYGWYQCRWHKAAKEIYDEGKITAFTNLWKTLGNNQENLEDQEFARLLSEKVHQSVANVQLNWDK